MVIPRDIRQRIERGDFDAVELAWLEDLENDANNVDHFVSIGRALVGAGQNDLARTLLELLDEELRVTNRHAVRMELLRAGGTMLAAKGRLHSAVLATLRDLHGANRNLEGLIETLGLDRSQKDPGQIWDRVARLESLLLFTEESVVWVDGHGPGCIGAINYELETFRVDLETGADMAVGFRAAPKILQALSDDHFLVRKRKDPVAFQDQKPTEVLEQVLTSFGRPMTGAEIRDAIQGLVDRSRWNSWWTSAKKHPQVVASTTVRNAYSWADSSEDASEALWQRFGKAKPAGKLDILRRASTQDADLLDRMAAVVRKIAEKSRQTAPGTAFEVFDALERVSRPIEGAAEELVRTTTDWRLLVDGVPNRQLKQKAYELARTEREDWLDLFADGFARETEPALLNLLAERLQAESRERYDALLNKAVAQPIAAAALFTWIAERAMEEEEILERFGARLFRRVLDAPSREAFKPYRKRLVPLAESGGTLPKLLGHLSPADAVEALEAIRRASGFSTDQRQRLQDALTMKFPQLSEKEEPMWALASSIESKRAELKILLEEEIPKNRRAIETAREMGDLRENFEYKSARQRHEYLTARAERLATDLARSQIVDVDNVDCSEVRVGTRVHLETPDGSSQSITLLGPWESDPESGVLSYLSDVGQALLGAAPDTEIDLADGRVRVVAINAAELPSPG